MTNVFIDGSEGTTGLRLADRLSVREDIELIKIDPAFRKDEKERARLSNSADVVFLCLPDVAAAESARNITNPDTRVIDASTAHRTDDAWAYGLPELSKKHREAISKAKRVSVPGCHATGFTSLVYPVVKAGICPADYPFTCHSLTGYSGAGKPMIANYADEKREKYYDFPRQYALGLKHKHLPEMKKVSGIADAPLFVPIIDNFYAGMLVTVPLYAKLLDKKMGARDIHAFLKDYYAGQKAVTVMPFGAEEEYTGSMIDAGALEGSDRLEIFVCGNEGQILLMSRFDNLGKGASGAAIQCMNIMLGLDEMTGLEG